MNRIASAGFAAFLYLLSLGHCVGGDLLFAKASRNYDRGGVVGQAYRRELEPRMFPHGNWRQRLYCETPDAEANETVEIYLKPDGSRWISFHRARPALSPLIRYRPLSRQRVELTKELNKVRISSCEALLPTGLANELEDLWKAMLPGVNMAPLPGRFLVHGPAFIAFARQDDSVKTGRVCLAAYDTEAYSRFVEIVEDLKRLCNGTWNSKQTVLAKLPAKVRNLTARLSR